MQFSIASEKDYQGILDLQSRNYIGNLSDDEKANGYLSFEFTQKQFETMNNEYGIIVCKEQDKVLGYLCTSSVDFNREYALPAAMIRLYPQIYYHNRTLEQYNSIVAGPWCIEQYSRGKGVFPGLWNALTEILPKEINLVTTFIATNNPNSLYAAKKIGMEVVSQFKYNNNEFSILARGVNT